MKQIIIYYITAFRLIEFREKSRSNQAARGTRTARHELTHSYEKLMQHIDRPDGYTILVGTVLLMCCKVVL